MIDHKFLRAPMNANYYHKISDNMRLQLLTFIISDSSHQEGDENKSKLRIKN